MEDEYLYGVDSGYRELRTLKTRIIKETPKTFKVESAISTYGYSRTVSKSSSMVAKTEKAAIEIFIRNAQLKIVDLKRDIEVEKNDIEQAEKLL